MDDVDGSDDRLEVVEIECTQASAQNEEDDAGVEADGEAVDILDEPSMVFSSHSEPVFVLDFYPGNNNVIASGGQDDQALVWGTDGSSIAEIKGHKDSVIAVSFSLSGKYLATADMLGLIQVHNTSSKTLYWSYDCESDLEAMQWHSKSEEVLFAGLQNGDCYMLKVGSHDLKCYCGVGDGVTCINVTQSGLELVLGYNDGVCRIWNLKECRILSTVNINGSDSSCFGPCLCIKNSSSYDDQFFASAGDNLVLANYKSGKVLWNMSSTVKTSLREDDTDYSIESFSLCQSHKNLICLGRLSGNLEVWDLSSRSVRNTVTLEGAVVKIVFAHQNEPICLIPTSVGKVFCVDILTGSVMRQFFCHSEAILDLILADDDSFFVTSSEDCTARTFSLT